MVSRIVITVLSQTLTFPCCLCAIYLYGCLAISLWSNPQC